MTVSDQDTATFNELAFGRRPKRTSMTGPQEAVIVSVAGSGTSTSCYFTVPKVSTTYKFGPAPCPAGAAAGQRALAVFVGPGPGDPWIAAVTDVPKPAGF